MKIFITLLTICLAINSGISNTVTHKFTTSGNCSVCKARIEEAVNKLNGIDSVRWDFNYDVTMVIYDDQITNLNVIMKAIAQIGYDTEWYQGDSAAYAFLKGSCCEYERVIDYSQVQIGYLSWENIWVNIEDNTINNLSLSPTLINNGYFIIKNESKTSENLSMIIYNLSGSRVYSAEILPNSSDRFVLPNIPFGGYFVIITDKTNHIFKTRIIVQ